MIERNTENEIGLTGVDTSQITGEFIQHYSVQQVARMFQVTDYTVRAWIKDEKIEAIKLPGGLLRIPESEVKRLATVRYGDANVD